MTEILISAHDTSLTLVLVLLGIGVSAHNMRVANLCPPGTSNLYAFILAVCISSGVGMTVSSLQGNLGDSILFCLISAVSTLCSSLWLWSRDKNYPRIFRARNAEVRASELRRGKALPYKFPDPQISERRRAADLSQTTIEKASANSLRKPGEVIYKKF